MATQQQKHICTQVIATTAPTVDDDITYGYLPGQLWYDKTADNYYRLKVNTDGAAVWTLFGAGGGGGVTSVNTRTGVVTLVATDIPNFIASGASHAKGAVPDPGVTAGTTKFLREDATWAVPAGGGGGGLSVAVLQDQKSSGTNGGTFTSGAWRTRDLNTKVSDIGSIVTLSANQFTPVAGTYQIVASAPANEAAGSRHQTRIYNVTDSVVVAIGQNAYTASVGTVSVCVGVLVTDGTKVFELQHQTQTSYATYGYGVATNFGTEVYGQVLLTKIA